MAIIKDDVINSGGNYVDEPVVRDGNLITSRLPGDLPDFCRAIVRYLEEAPYRRGASTKPFARVAGRAATTADYVRPARVVQTSAGKASANYRMHAVEAK